MERYQNIIKGQMFGHNHEDSYELFRSLRDNKTFTSVGTINPTVGTLSNYNPAFRVYYINKDTYDIVDYYTYRLYINQANANNNPEWKLSYRFSTYYGYNASSLESFVDIAANLRTNKELAVKFMKMRQGEAGNWVNPANNTETMRNIWCKIVTPTVQEYYNCIGGYKSTDILSILERTVIGFIANRKWSHLVD